MKESEDEEERADFEEVLYENGPLIQTEHHNTKQLETVIKFLFEKMSLTENTLKRMQNKKKMTVLAERRATVLAQQAGRPGSSQGDKDQPPPPSPMKLASDAWAKCTTDTERLNCLFEMMQKTTASVEKMKAESIHNNAIQAAKDDAQDEMMQMEMDSMERKLASCLKHRDMKETLKIVEAEQQSQEANLKRMIMNNRREVSEELDQQLEKVFNQLRKISNSYEDQEKLLQTQIAEMVNQELTSPSFPAPAMQEKVIIREGKAHVVARPTTGSGVDASVLTKLKNSVAEMELSAANNSNLIERLNEQCEMASKRARDSEDLVKALETQLVETTTTLESSLTEKVEEQAAQQALARRRRDVRDGRDGDAVSAEGCAAEQARDALPEGDLLVEAERGGGVSLERDRRLHTGSHRGQRRRGRGRRRRRRRRRFDEGVHRVLVHVEDEAGGGGSLLGDDLGLLGVPRVRAVIPRVHGRPLVRSAGGVNHVHRAFGAAVRRVELHVPVHAGNARSDDGPLGPASPGFELLIHGVPARFHGQSRLVVLLQLPCAEVPGRLGKKLVAEIGHHRVGLVNLVRGLNVDVERREILLR